MSLHGMQWNTASGSRSSNRSISVAGRRTSDGERQVYDNNTMANDTFMMPTNQSSSLLGVMGEGSNSPYARVPPLYPNNTMGWSQEMSMMPPNTDTYPTGVPGHSSMFTSLPTPGYENLDAARNASPESMGPGSPSYYPVTGEYMMPVSHPSYRDLSSGGSSGGSQSPYPREDPDSEVRRLRKKVKELQQALRDAHAAPPPSGSSAPTNIPPAFRSEWKRRTEARKKNFCSLNRAGNALCAWHDSRRERRQFPPRNAPHGMLNCGCTYEEALFEESLARHKVGGYLPGESVRMDPELRRPLLRLLQQRYGYKDGDFDHDPQTMQWHPGQDPETWERQAHSGSSSRARRSEPTDRH
ncbi:hypothetical protein P691DRAFT_783510 [Macrolepiota fuliginosa MF-IS2]|uniref:Uncharacterized protein n=1 Tax=Macrolepiota fuliginosa MF-IS2 TaxID=1400762 RepID=A0A9P6BZS2_9AGAR|nr:hypothetical protein P691DRAFT_783510 [Macrolepiota fuliginosa MF-IS2]